MATWQFKDDPQYAWFEVMEGDRQVANVDRKSDAERIVWDHNEVERLRHDYKLSEEQYAAEAKHSIQMEQLVRDAVRWIKAMCQEHPGTMEPSWVAGLPESLR